MKNRNLPSREKRKLPKSARNQRDTGTGAQRRTLSHPLFGEIPLVEVFRTDSSGKTWRYSDYDPDYRPPMPAGGVAGDIRKQSYCIMCHAPRYFYLDETRRCVQCGKDFVFAATEQKFWYETLKFHFDSVAIRCPGCRKRRRTERFLRQQLEMAVKSAGEKPADPVALIDLAEATLAYFQRFGQGDLARAVSACRKARKLSPGFEKAETLEARLQQARKDNPAVDDA